VLSSAVAAIVIGVSCGVSNRRTVDDALHQGKRPYKRLFASAINTVNRRRTISIHQETTVQNALLVRSRLVPKREIIITTANIRVTRLHKRNKTNISQRRTILLASGEIYAPCWSCGGRACTNSLGSQAIIAIGVWNIGAIKNFAEMSNWIVYIAEIA
jgi:hypothetical protein